MKRKYQPHGFAARLTPLWKKYQARLFTVRAARAAGQVKRVSVRRRTSQRGAATRSSGASGDGNSDDPDPDPERPIPAAHQPHQLYDQASLANLLILSKKSVQNIYSKTPHLLPPAIKIPGARGPRWTVQAIEEWLATRPQHTSKSAPVALHRKVGRPRIAVLHSNGGAGGASC